jgi:glycosyltransferase involved in cell wall biosynthesis
VRVLHVTAYFAPAFCYGGPPRSVLGLCRGLAQAGVDVEVFTTTANGDGELPASPPQGDNYEGVRVRYFPLAFPRRLFGARRMDAALGGLGERYDLVHVHGLWNVPEWKASRRARRARVPYVISPRGMLEAGALARHAAAKRLGYRLVERRNLVGAALLHASSVPEAAAIEQRRLGVPIAVVPNGVEGPDGIPPARGEFRQRYGVPPGAPLVAFIGRIHPIKRLDLLAAAFDRVLTGRPDAHLVVAGPDEVGHRRALAPHFARAGERAHFTGELGESEKWSLLADADVLALCSDSESFGLSVLEALAAGVPVVATRTCPWEDVERTGAGFWVPQDPRAMAEALGRILDEPAAARAMGERGRELARSRYSWESIGRAMAEQYRHVTARRASPASVS